MFTASFFTELLLTLYNRLCWANRSASAAVNAKIWVDRIDVTFRDSLLWALSDASTTCNACIFNNVCHKNKLLNVFLVCKDTQLNLNFNFQLSIFNYLMYFCSS